MVLVQIVTKCESLNPSPPPVSVVTPAAPSQTPRSVTVTAVVSENDHPEVTGEIPPGLVTVVKLRAMVLAHVCTGEMAMSAAAKADNSNLECASILGALVFMIISG